MSIAQPDYPQEFPFFVIGNKLDKDEREVNYQHLIKWCRNNGDMPFMEISAKEIIDVEKALEAVTEKAIDFVNKKERNLKGSLSVSES